MVAREQGAAGLVREAQMVGRMARRRNGSQAAAVDLDPLAVGKHPIGHIVGVEAGIGPRADDVERERRTADHRRAGGGGQRPRRGTVVAVGMGAQDGGNRPPRDRGEQSLDMLVAVGPGIDHRQGAGADQEAVGAGKGERRRVGRQQARNARLKRLGYSVGRVHARAVPRPAAAWQRR